MHDILCHNLRRLSMRISSFPSSRCIAFIGQPGAGKSTLLDMLTDGKIKPRPTIGVMTDTTDWSKNSQVNLFHEYNNIKIVDLPGYGTAAHPTQKYIDLFPFWYFDDILIVIKEKILAVDQQIYNHLTLCPDQCRSFASDQVVRMIIKNPRKPKTPRIIIVRNCMEGVTREEESKLANDLIKFFPLCSDKNQLFFTSCRSERGLNELNSKLKLNW